jgi:hypothetical protein
MLKLPIESIPPPRANPSWMLCRRIEPTTNVTAVTIIRDPAKIRRTRRLRSRGDVTRCAGARIDVGLASSVVACSCENGGLADIGSLSRTVADRVVVGRCPARLTP